MRWKCYIMYIVKTAYGGLTYLNIGTLVLTIVEIIKRLQNIFCWLLRSKHE